MESDSLRNSAEPADLGGDRISNVDSFSFDASTPTTKLESLGVSQTAIDQDLAENNTGNGISVHTCSPPQPDLHDSRFPSSHPGDVVTTNLDNQAVSQVATDQDPAEDHSGDAILVQTSSPPRSDSLDRQVQSSRAGDDITTNLNHAVSQVATDQDLAEEHTGDAIPVHTSSQSPSDSDSPQVLNLEFEASVTFEGFYKSLRRARLRRLTSLARRSRPYSLPTNIIGVGESTSPNNADAEIVTMPRILPTPPSLLRASNPFEMFLKDLFANSVYKPGDKPGSSVIGDCVVSWKPSVVPHLFEFKYWFKQFKKKCVFLVQDHHLRRESPQEEAENLVEAARSKVVIEVIKEGKRKEELAKLGKKEREEKAKIRGEQEAQKKADQEATLRVIAQHALDERGGIKNYSLSDAAVLAELAELEYVDPESVHRLSDLSGLAWVENSTREIGMSAVQIFDGEVVNESDKKRMRRSKLISTHKQKKTAQKIPEAEDAKPREEHGPDLHILFARANKANADGGRKITWEDYGDFQGNSKPGIVAAGTTVTSVVTLDDYEDYEENADPTELASSSKSGESSKLVRSGAAKPTSRMASNHSMESQAPVLSHHKASHPFLFDFDLQDQGGNTHEEYYSAEEDSVTLSGDESPPSTAELSVKARGKLPAKGKGHQVKRPLATPELKSPSKGKGKRHVVKEVSSSPNAEVVSDTEESQSGSPNAGDHDTTRQQGDIHAVTASQVKKEPLYLLLDEARGRGASVRKERSDSVRFLRKRTLSRESSKSASQPPSSPRRDSITKFDSSVVEESEEEISGATIHTPCVSELSLQAPEEAPAKKDDIHDRETHRVDDSTGQDIGVVETNPSSTATKGPPSGGKKSKSKSKKAKRNHKFQANLAQVVKEDTFKVLEVSSTAENIQRTQAPQRNELDANAFHEPSHDDAQLVHKIRVAEPIGTGLNEEVVNSVQSTEQDKLGAATFHEESHKNVQVPRAAAVADPISTTLSEEVSNNVKSAEQLCTVAEPSSTTLNEQVLDRAKSAEHSETTDDATATIRKQASKNTQGLRIAKAKAPVARASQPSNANKNKSKQVQVIEADFPNDDRLADFSINNNLLVNAMTDPGLIAGGLIGPRLVQEGVMDDLSEDEMETTNRNFRHPRELAPYTPYADQKKWIYRNQDRRINMANLKEKYVLVDKPTSYLRDPSTETVIRWSPHCKGATAVVTGYETDRNVPLIEYDKERNRFIIYPHAQPWKDLRNDALHPDFLPGHKLAEYQAYEYAGFSVWRHDRAQLKCALPRCTKMLEDYDPNVLICNGCGIKSYVRYCNRPHLLEDIENHWKICGATPIMGIIDGNTQPSRFYRRYPAIVEKHGFNSEQRHRQRANNIGATAAEYGLFNDGKILYFGIILDNWYDRDRFNRCFNACLFDITQTQILSFMFRTIRCSLRKDGSWSQDKKIVLIRQFKAEFNFDYEAQLVASHDVCDCEWFGESWNVSRCTPDCKQAHKLVGETFRAKGIDQMLTDLEAQHWILRVWRRHCPRRPKNWEERMRGVGFPGVPKWQRSIEFRPAMGEGWEGWGNGGSELCL